MDYFKSTSIKQLEQMYKQEKDQKVKAKLLVVIHKKENKKIDEIAKALRISEPTVKRAVRRFREQGKEGLYRKPGSGSSGYLSETQKHRLVKHIEETNTTSREINAYIKDNFGKSYHPFAMPKFLRSLGFSRITPRKQHYKADKTKQEEWKADFKKSPKSIWIRDTKSSSKTKQ